jgi:ribosomal protein S18 acetylase RimI-like enzyme
VPAEVTLRRATAVDVDAAAELHAWSWQVTYGPLLAEAERALLTVDERRRLWQRVLAEPRPLEWVWLAERGGRLAGLVFHGTAQDDDATRDVAEIHAIHVAPGLHGRGIGSALMQAALGDLAAARFRRATLWVIRENAEARRFYEGRGWRPDGREKHAAMGDFPGLPIVHEVRYGRLLEE